jgi:hypothetical protein
MAIKEHNQEQQDRLTFGDLAEYMLTLGELHNLLEESNAPQKYAIQIKIMDEIDAIIDALSIRK